MAIVKFNADISPYMTGDVVRLEGDEKKRVDEAAKDRNLKDAYSTVQPAKAKTEAKAKTKSKTKAKK